VPARVSARAWWGQRTRVMRAGSVALHASCGTAAQNFIPSRISLTIIVVTCTQGGHSLLIPIIIELLRWLRSLYA